MKYRAMRFPAEFKAELLSGSGKRPVTLIDTNTTGARLFCRDPLMVGEDIALVVFDCKLRGQVRWVSGQRAGIAFLPMIPQHLVDRITYCNGQRRSSGRFNSMTLQELR